MYVCTTFLCRKFINFLQVGVIFEKYRNNTTFYLLFFLFYQVIIGTQIQTKQGMMD